MILERNQRYSGPYGGNVGRVELSLVNDGTLLDEYAADRIECLYLPLLSALNLGQATRNFGNDLVSLPSMATAYLAFNCARPPFDDQRVRQAFALAMDTKQLTDGVLHGLHDPALSGFIPPGVAGHGLGPKAGVDLEEARRLLAEAGYPDGQGFPQLTIYEFARAGAGYSTGSWICEQLQESLGLKIALRQTSMAEIVAYQQSEGRQLWHLGWSVDYSDADGFMRAGDWPGACNWPNARFEEVVEAARYETSQERRLALYRQAEMILAEQAPLIPILYARWQMLVKPWVRRLATSPTVWTIFRDVVVEDEWVSG
jgi:oligopeptide transport system substrate-binding protein